MDYDKFAGMSYLEAEARDEAHSPERRAQLRREQENAAALLTPNQAMLKKLTALAAVAELKQLKTDFETAATGFAEQGAIKAWFHGSRAQGEKFTQYAFSAHEALTAFTSNSPYGRSDALEEL